MMRLRSVFAFALTFCACGQAGAEQSWMLRRTNPTQYAIEIVSERGVQTVGYVGDRPTFGIGNDALAFLSTSSPSNASVLDIASKQSRQVIASWPIAGRHLSELVGPSNTLYLSDDAAYFATSPEIGHPTRNALGGSFNLNRLSRANGRQRSYPLPEDCSGPQVAAYDGVPIVYSRDGVGLWKLDVDRDQLVRIVGFSDAPEIFAPEREAARTNSLSPAAFAQYLPVPGKGIFRLSMFGQLHQILRSDLSIIRAPRPTLDLGKGPFLEMVAVRGKRGVAIGVVRRNDKGGSTMQLIDPDSLEVTSERTVPDLPLDSPVVVWVEDAVR